MFTEGLGSIAGYIVAKHILPQRESVYPSKLAINLSAGALSTVMMGTVVDAEPQTNPPLGRTGRSVVAGSDTREVSI